jgi:hypothetical protein
VQAGPDRTQARHQDTQRIPPDLERAILSIGRRQLFDGGHGEARRVGPGRLSAPLPGAIERVPKRNGLTSPRVCLAPLLPRQEYPAGKLRS